MAALFLLESAKKVDDHFGAHRSSQHHISDPSLDIQKMSKCLLDESVTKQVSERSGSSFIDPVVKGMEKLAGGWLDRIFNELDDEPDPGETTTANNEDLDVAYELYHTT